MGLNPQLGAPVITLILAAGAPAQPCTPRWSTEFASALNGPVSGLLYAAEPGGPVIYAGGAFTIAGGVSAERVVRYDASGWSPLGSGIAWQNSSGWGNSYVTTLVLFDDGTGLAIYAGGLFSYSGTTHIGIPARWTGSQWTGVAGGVRLEGCFDCQAIVYDMIVHDDGEGAALFVAGAFDRIGTGAGIPAEGIARWNGAEWSNLGVMGNSWIAEVSSLAVFESGGGSALYASGMVDRHIGLSRWNGAAWSPVSGSDGRVAWDMLVFDDGAGPALYLAENGLLPGPFVRRWDGQTWTTLGNDFNGSVRSLASFDDGTGEALYAAGSFGLGGARGIARWDGAQWRPVGGGVGSTPTATVYSIVTIPAGATDPGSLILGGSFTTVGAGTPSARIARWIGCPAGTCYPDCNLDGTLTAADFACFQSQFAAGSPFADCNADTALTVADFGCFQTRFVSGCP